MVVPSLARSINFHNHFRIQGRRRPIEQHGNFGLSEEIGFVGVLDDFAVIHKDDPIGNATSKAHLKPSDGGQSHQGEACAEHYSGRR